MLEKIGLPAKPSLRGNNWVVDASHCQGCSSQFTFINRKHHCRRCGGIFCGSCTQHRMYLRGQGDSPVRICEPCKRLEEASRFEKYGHKPRAGRGSSRVTSQPEDETLNQVLGNDGKESGQETNNNVGSSMQRRTSGASCSNGQEEYNQEEMGSLSVEESNHSQNASGSTTPEELRQQALDEKKKYKQLKGEGKQTEALRAFKKGKELERQADALEISLRKKRRKVILSDNVTESQIKDDRSESRRSSRITAPVGREKDDLSAELKELGWSDMDLRDENKTQANLTLEGELSSLLGEISGKNKKDKGNSAIDKTQVLAYKKKALQLKREGKLAEAKEELKKSKVLEKQLEEQEFLVEAEESDDELSSLIHSMDDDKDDFSVQYKQADDFNFESLISVADDDHMVDSNFEVTDEDLEDPEIAAALNSLGWTQDDTSPPKTSATQVATVDKEAKLAEIKSLKREALTHKRAGNVPEAMAQLNKAKLLERDLENIESHEGNAVRPSAPVHKQSIDSSSKPLMVGDGNISTMEHIDSKASKKSISMIRKELLALKRKSLALRREGRLDEAEEELKRGRILEQQLEEMENGSTVETVPETVGSKNLHLGEHANVSRSPSFADEEGDNVTDQDMYDPTYLSILKNLGWNEDDNEVANSSSKHYKQTDSMQVSESSAAHPPADLLVGGSRRSKAEIQRELLGVKRKALALRRQGDSDGAEEMLIKAKTLEDQMANMEAPKKEVQSDFCRHKEKIVVPPLNIAEEEDDGEDVTENDMQDPALLSVLQTLGWKDEEQSGDPSLPESATKLSVAPPRSKGEIQRELLDLKRKAFAFRRKGETEEAEEVLKMAKVLEAQLEELDGPKRLQPHHYSKEEKPGSFGLLINSDKQGSLKDAMEGERSTQAEMGRTDKVVKLPVGSGSMRSHAVNPLLKDTDFIGHPTSQSVKENQSSGVSGETSYQDNRRVVQGASQTSPLVQSGNFVDLLTGNDWRSCPGSTEGHDSVGSFSATPPIQLGYSREDLTKQEYAVVQKREDMVMKQDAKEAILVQGSSTQKNESSIRQDILVFKRRALALKREGKLAEAREELRQAKVLEKHLEEDSPQSKTSPSDVSDSAYHIPPADQKRLEKENPPSKPSSSDVSGSVPPAGQKHHGSPSSDQKPMSSRDRFKLQQKSLGHKRQALKLRREGRVEEAEAEFELAKALETQLEESAAHDSKAVEPVDDVAIEGFLDPQLLAALKAVGIEDANVSSSQGPGRPEHPKPIIGKSDGGTQDESNLEEQIKAEKVKALHLKRAGKQAEALDALRRAKMLEKKLSAFAPK